MNYLNYKPEGSFFSTAANNYYLNSQETLREAGTDQIFEHIALSADAAHALHLRLPCGDAVIPREECALGIAEGQTKDIAILSRVGKSVCFQVVNADREPFQLSRRAAQESMQRRMMHELRPGHILKCRLTHIEPFGIFVDIGCGIPSFIGIENISVSRIENPAEHFAIGQELFAVVTGIDHEKNRIFLSHKELLGTWEENAQLFHAGETVQGTVRSIEPYGIFVELTPNLSGLADLKPGYQRGDKVSVHIRSILPQRMKVKLNIIDHIEEISAGKKFRYYLPDEPYLRRWQYSPAVCKTRNISAEYEPMISPLL